MSESTVVQKQGIFELLRNRSYAQFMLARTISRFGDSVDSIAYGWMVYLLTGSKLLMGTLMAVNFLPNILFGLFAGAMVDRMSPQKVIVLAYAGRGTLVGLTALLFSLGELQVWHLFVMTVLVSLLECFATPAETSSVPRLLPPGLLLSGNALSSSIARMSELAGIAAAGALIAGAGIAWTLWIDAALFGASAFFMAKVVFPGIRPDVVLEDTSEPGEAAAPHGSLFSEIIEAFRFLRTIPVLLMTSFLFAFVNFCLMPFNVLRTPYVTEILNAGPERHAGRGRPEHGEAGEDGECEDPEIPGVAAEDPFIIDENQRQPQAVIGEDRNLPEAGRIGEDEKRQGHGCGAVDLIRSRADQARLRYSHAGLTASPPRHSP